MTEVYTKHKLKGHHVHVRKSARSDRAEDDREARREVHHEAQLAALAARNSVDKHPGGYTLITGFNDNKPYSARSWASSISGSRIRPDARHERGADRQGWAPPQLSAEAACRGRRARWGIRDMCLRSGDGFPDVLLVDHDPKFTSNVFRAFAKGMGSCLIVGSA